MGWVISQFAIMINKVAVYACCKDTFPKHQVCKNDLLVKAVLNFLTLSLNLIVFFL